MPHKDAAASAVDRCSSVADALGAVNTVSWRGDELFGDNTDGAGFLDALRLDEGFDPEGRRCVVVGAGGAARAVVHALGGAGAADIAVVNRSAERAHVAAALSPAARVAVMGECGEADLIVNATPVGMGADGNVAVDPAHLGPGQLVVDLVYRPAITPLVDAARAAGATAVNGIGMLIHQAAHAFRQWTGEDPPLEVMSAAALAALAAEG
jgi:shikimate dehydrogenase